MHALLLVKVEKNWQKKVVKPLRFSGQLQRKLQARSKRAGANLSEEFPRGAIRWQRATHFTNCHDDDVKQEQGHSRRHGVQQDAVLEAAAFSTC